MSSEIARRVLALVRTVAPPRAAEHELTVRELDVLRALAAGHSYKTTARELDLAIDCTCSASSPSWATTSSGPR